MPSCPVYSSDPNLPWLYGLYHTNRRQTPRGQNGKTFWGKNEFNSSFPAALACYMRDRGKSAVYISLNDKLQVVSGTLSIDDLFGTTLPNDQIAFLFESKYEPYQQLVKENIGNIDLVIAEKESGRLIRPLEIKLTVIPDNTTCNRPEDEWGAELVIRPATAKYCGLGILSSLNEYFTDSGASPAEHEFRRKTVEEIFNEPCEDIHRENSWTVESVVANKSAKILSALNTFQKKFYGMQRPLLMQPLWRTQGKTPLLHEEGAFDIVVWSDMAFTRLFLDTALRAETDQNGRASVSRRMRCAARLARLLFESTLRMKPSMSSIFSSMAYSYQTDKEFSASGQIWRSYVDHKRIQSPAVKKEAIFDIIRNGGEELLSPERRFDQTVTYLAQFLKTKTP